MGNSTRTDRDRPQRVPIVVVGINPGHPFLKAVIEMVLRNTRTYTPLDGFAKFAILRVTGPITYTLAIVPLLTNILIV